MDACLGGRAGGLLRSRGCETKIFILSLEKGRKGGRERVEALFRFALLCCRRFLPFSGGNVWKDGC